MTPDNSLASAQYERIHPYDVYELVNALTSNDFEVLGSISEKIPGSAYEMKRQVLRIAGKTYIEDTGVTYKTNRFDEDIAKARAEKRD